MELAKDRALYGENLSPAPSTSVKSPESPARAWGPRTSDRKPRPLRRHQCPRRGVKARSVAKNNTEEGRRKLVIGVRVGSVDPLGSTSVAVRSVRSQSRSVRVGSGEFNKDGF